VTFLRKNGLDGEDFEVTVHYTDLPGAQYWNSWDIQPAIYEGLRSPARPAQHAHDQAGDVADAGGGAPGRAPRADRRAGHGHDVHRRDRGDLRRSAARVLLSP